MGFGGEIDNKEEEEGDVQEWRKESEEASIVSNFTMTLTHYTTVSTVYSHLILLPLPLTFAFQAYFKYFSFSLA